MKILFFPQISTRSYTDNKWFLLKSGHIQVIKNQIKAIERFSSDKNNLYIICVPPKPQLADRDQDYLYDMGNIRSKIYSYDFRFSKNVALNRFQFDMNDLIENKLDFENIDTFFNDSPELTRNFLFFFKHLNKTIKIISNVHYLDIYPENSSGTSQYFWRQIDGIDCSDKCTFFTQKMMDDFYTYAQDYISTKKIEELKQKSSVLDYMLFSQEEMNLYKNQPISKNVLENIDCQDFRKDDTKLITFISRCSDEKRTKWKEFIESVKILRQRREDFKVVITNPSDAPLSQLVKAIGSGNNFLWFPKDKLSRADYIRLLWNSDIVPILYDISNNISVGFAEAMYCQTRPVQFGADFNDMKVLDIALDNALDAILNRYQERRQEIIQNSCCELNSERFYKEYINV